MLKTTKQKLDREFTIGLGVCCIIAVFMLAPFAFNVYASAPQISTTQQRIEREAQDLQDQRITKLEVELDEAKEKLNKMDPIATEGRLTRLESSLDTIKSLLITLACGIGLMLLEAGHRLLSTRQIMEIDKKE